MKNLLLFTLCALFLMACGTHGTGDPERDTISIGTAFGIVAKSWSYWVFIFLSLLPAAYYLMQYYRGKIEEVDLKVLFGCLVLISFAVFFRPCEIAANTSITAFNRGNIIGY